MHAESNVIRRQPGSCVTAGLRWVSPNAPLDRLDSNALERWTGPRAENPVVPFDSLQYPDWYAREKHWHPWVPHRQDGLWWHRLAHDPIFQALNDEVKAKKDLSVMVKILGVIYKRVRPEGPRPDNMYLVHGLNLGVAGQQDHACRFMLSAGGYIRWLKAHRSNDIDRCLKEHLTSQDAKHMLSWGLDQPGGVGVILDLTRDQKEMNIGLYLRHNIPVYYPWTASAAADTALCHLSPFQFLSQADEWSNQSPHVDFFLQPLLPAKRGLAVLAQNLPPLTHFILDFQGWIPRSISRKAGRGCFRLFYFEENLADKGPTPSYIRVFHRFRPHVPPTPEHLAMYVCIRERWKFDHAPPAGQFYDAATQQLEYTPPITAPITSPLHSSWGLMLPPSSYQDVGCSGPARSPADDPAALDSAQSLKKMVVQVNLGSLGGLDTQIQHFILRLPDQLRVPHDGGLWST
ncbi:hypothetical protein BDR07DRAFT_1484228 [Suillus spraguei]|nr:hypothetical protein BDR07DRAFT_1484228 [Suillus spraguei]